MESLEEHVRRMGPRMYDNLKKVYSDIARGSIELLDPSPPRSFVEYLRRPDYCAWLYSSLAVVALTIANIILSDIVRGFLPLRYFLGLLFTLFIPGYATVEALYPDERSLTPLERVALSIGLSLALVPLLGLLLNYTPWGIRLAPVVLALTLYSISTLLLAGYRKYKLVALLSKSSTFVEKELSRSAGS